ncbi:conserved hypothetical protein, partial [Ricinus communis]
MDQRLGQPLGAYAAYSLGCVLLGVAMLLDGFVVPRVASQLSANSHADTATARWRGPDCRAAGCRHAVDQPATGAAHLDGDVCRLRGLVSGCGVDQDSGLAAHRRLDAGDVDFLHRHHGLEGALGDVAALEHGLGQHARRDLPRQAPLVLAPAARALGAAIADDGFPVAVRLRLVFGRNLEGEGFAVLEGRAAVEAQAWYAAYREFDRQHLPGRAAGEIGRRAVHGADGAIGEGAGVKIRRLLRVLVVPQADRVLGRHHLSPLFAAR